MNFVSETQLKTEESSTDKPEEPVDRRPLYHRLKEVRDKAQAEYDEQHALKNQFRGLDEDETNFLDKIDEMKYNAEKKKREEERELLKAQAIANAALTSAGPSVGLLFTPVTSSESKQKKDTLRKLVVVKRKQPEGKEAGDKEKSEIPSKVSKKTEEEAKKKEDTVQPAKAGVISSLVAGYDYSSSEEEADDS